MKTKRILGIVLLATGLLASGCGGVETETPPGDASGAREDAIWVCEVGSNWHIDYFSDAGRSQWTGAYDCNCEGQLTFLGRRTSYSTSSPPQACY